MTSLSENRSVLREFLASIATIRGDLSNITAPPFVLATKSAVEFPQYWAEHPSLFVAPAAEPDPQKRALLVLKWFLGSLKSQQYAGRDPSQGVKKPLNAFLGELFLAHWDDDEGSTHLISEQVSHHPPVTATMLWNDQHGIRAEGYTCQEITFNGSVNIKQIGHAILHIDEYDEDYFIPLPSVKVKGILSGTPYPELTGHYRIVSTNGYTSEIDFSGRGFFSGTKNSFDAKMYRDGQDGHPLYTITGQWNDVFTIHDVENDEEIESYDTKTKISKPLTIADRSDQDPWESRNAWGKVIDALNRGDMRATSNEKGKIEKAQRVMRKKEETRGEKWQQAFFKSLDRDPVFEELAAKIGANLDIDRTCGIWKFDREKLMQDKPYHGDLTPLGNVNASEMSSPALSPEKKDSSVGRADTNGLREETSPPTPPERVSKKQQELSNDKEDQTRKKQIPDEAAEDFIRARYGTARS